MQQSNLKIETEVMVTKMIYLDNAATTKPDYNTFKAASLYLLEDYYNPSALYSKAYNVKKAIVKCRSSIAESIGASLSEIYFTSGATESNNWVLRGYVDWCMINEINPCIIISEIEHKSITDCVTQLKRVFSSLEVCKIPVDSKGYIKTNVLQRIIEDVSTFCKIPLVSIQFANSEIGTIQKIISISKIVHNHNGVFHTDATQVMGHFPIDVKKLNIDLLSASAQKFGGFKGTGILYMSNTCCCIQPLILGSQERGQRGGTENVAGIVAMNEALKTCTSIFVADNMIEVRDYFIKRLIDEFGCKINGIYDKNNPLCRLINNINVTFPQNITGESLIYLLDIAGIMISSGSACNSRENVPSPVLKAIGLTDDEIMRTVRLTISKDTTKNDVDQVIEEINKAIKLLNMDNIGQKTEE